MAEAAQAAGARRLRFADTLGVLDPFGVFERIRDLRALSDLEIEMHAHDDLGLATANTLAAVRGGATHVNTTVNGLGERAGNAALEEVVMGLKHLHGIETGVDLSGSRACRAWSPAPPAARWAGRRAWSAMGCSPTRPASTSTGCSRTRATTRASTRRSWAAATAWCWASIPAGVRCAGLCRSAAGRAGPGPGRAVLTLVRRFATQSKRSPRSKDLLGFLREIGQPGLVAPLQ